MRRLKKCKYGGGKPTYQLGGFPQQKDYPDYESYTSAVDEYTQQGMYSPQPNNIGYGKQLSKEEQNYMASGQSNVPIDGHKHGYMESVSGNLKLPTTSNPKPTASAHGMSYQKAPNYGNALMDTGLLMDAFSGAASYFSGIADRKRQNQYDYQQQALLGQMNAMPANDYQPNPYSMYAKYGGRLKHYMMHDMGFSNDAHMGKGDETMHGEMQQGGMTRGMIPTPTYQGMQTGDLPDIDKGMYLDAFKDYYYHPNKWPSTASADKSIASDYLYQKDTAGYNDWMRYSNNSLLAQKDAATQNLMTPSQIHSELYRPVVMPPDAIKKQQGGISDPYFAQQFGERHNIPILAHNGYSIGTPPVVDQNGNPYQAPTARALPITVPSYVQSGDMHSAQGKAWYVNPQTGDTVDVDPSIMNSKRFKAPVDQSLSDLAMRSFVTNAKFAEGGKWLQKAVNPAHKGWCTPLSKSTCTGHRRQFALMMKKKHGFQ